MAMASKKNLSQCRLFAVEILNKISDATLSQGRATDRITIWQIISLHIKVYSGHIRKFCALYSQYGKDSVQLGALAYNCGSGVVNKSSLLKNSAEATATPSRNIPPIADTKANSTSSYTNTE